MTSELRLPATSTLEKYMEHLRQEERSANTIEKYTRDLKAFLTFLAGSTIDKTAVLRFKDYLTGKYTPASVNSMLAAVNGFLEWIGLTGCKVKPIKIQREIFAKPEKELTRDEYMRLIKAAEKEQNSRLSLLIQTICATGIRVSELRYITAEALQNCRAIVDCKGKTRTVFLPADLCRILVRYCRKQKIERGVIFRTRSGNPIDRTNIWRDMKALCISADVEPGKVFPHNLRHLFARTYYRQEKDLSRLADLLGHTNVNTTRIYTMESGHEHVKQLNHLGLLLKRTKKTT